MTDRPATAHDAHADHAHDDHGHGFLLRASASTTKTGDLGGAGGAYLPDDHGPEVPESERAGARGVLSYFALDAARLLRKK